MKTLTITPATGRIAFVTEAAFDTSAGLSGADAQCQNEAAAQSLPNASTFLALLATSTQAPASRFTLTSSSMPYVRPDGIKIANALAIASGSALQSGIWQHADGSYVTALGGTVWTGSTLPSSAGTLATTCQDWSTLNGANVGSLGESSLVDPGWWATGGSSSCGDPWSIYCLEP